MAELGKLPMLWLSVGGILRLSVRCRDGIVSTIGRPVADVVVDQVMRLTIGAGKLRLLRPDLLSFAAVLEVDDLAAAAASSSSSAEYEFMSLLSLRSKSLFSFVVDSLFVVLDMNENGG